MVLHGPNVVSLCVDFYDREQQQGRLYHQYTAKAIPFLSLLEALCQMNRLYDDLQFPQASTEMRSFQIDRMGRSLKLKRHVGLPELPAYECGKVKEAETFDKVTEYRGKDATFLIRVQYRQNSSWQGEVTWVDGRKREYFRSALELVRLIDSAMHVQHAGK